MSAWTPPSDEDLRHLRTTLDQLEDGLPRTEVFTLLVAQLDQSVAALRAAGFTDISIGGLMASQVRKAIPGISDPQMVFVVDRIGKTQ